MLGFSDLPYTLKAVFLVFVFISVCSSICLMPIAFRRKHFLSGFLILFCYMAGSTMLILFAAQVKSYHPSWKTSAAAEYPASLPVIFPVILLVMIVFILLVSIKKEKKYEKNAITRSSVKESFDYLNTGLCFACKNGRVILINHCMNHLCHTILGRDLQNVHTFWNSILNGTLGADVERFSMGENPSFHLPDQSIWTFSYKEIDGTIQITAAETTNLYILSEELNQNNRELSAMNERLKKYSENMTELTRERERLETRARIHRELGQALLSARYCLQKDPGDYQKLIHILKRNISMLRYETEVQSIEDPFQILTKTASAAGIEVHITGNPPETESVIRLFFEAASEALTNAVRHANAKTLNIDMSEDEKSYFICFTNDGSIPRNEIIEGGGLSSLRKKTEQEGGTMKIICNPDLILSISLPKNRGDDLC